MKKFSIVLLFFTVSTSFFLQADNIEKITITAEHIHRDKQAETSVKVTDPDLSSWLTSVPGANINRNGALTGIAQYRGLFGDRVAINLNGHHIVGAGPNAMDSPLSYGPTFLVESMSVYQGVAPVSAGIETLGGAIAVKTLHAESDFSQGWQTNGQLKSTYKDNNNARSFSTLVNASKRNWAILSYVDWQKADDEQTSEGILITPTRYKKNQAGTDIRYFTDDDNNIGISYHYTNTQNSGTPALPMDIKSILAHRVNIDGTNQLANWQLQYQLGFVNNTHTMDNFTLRKNNDPAKFRHNYADAETVDYKLTAKNEHWLIGFDGYLAQHNSTITNPNNPAFRIINFNKVKDQRISLFSQWQADLSQVNINAGLRVKFIKASSGEVDHFMAMMSPSIKKLRESFNQSDRTINDTNVDLAINLSFPLTLQNKNNSAELLFAAGIKQRAPSYQERYLWLPMESTGGLADGKTYLGNINLKHETAYQSDIGLNYYQEDFNFTIHAFYQKINDYIQGVPATNINANMVAKMMTGNTPLQYDNVAAELYGSDGSLSYQLHPNFKISAIISYVRGKRTDINDNLYRISPLNGRMILSYQTINAQGLSLQANFTLAVSDKQNKVSTTNAEKTSSGYALINADINYELSDNLIIKAGIYNALNRSYRNHLGGYNRVKESNIAGMARLPKQGRSIWAELSYYF
ncbi:MAG: TonB-dependent receptor [Gammaproteobacteria bacterium]|nr:MAG: TonB-dependent receptor [Gammaproteobacteria bacterium]